MSIGSIPKCRNLEDSYGEICVHCNKCKRFDFVVRCVNCGTKKKVSFSVPRGWADIEFYDGWFNVCTKCKKYFTKEELRKELQAVIPCKRRNFKRRTNA